jgi:hypothetical protein
MAFLLYLWQWQAEAMVWAQCCLVTLHIQLSAVLPSHQTGELRIYGHLFDYQVVR